MSDMKNVAPQPLREPKQSRSKILMQSVREATLALIQELGPGAVTTVKIAERAGISPGSLYRYYPNKQAIFTDIFNVELAKLDSFMQEGSGGTGLNGTLEEAFYEVHVFTQRIYRELLELHGEFFIEYHRQFDFTLRENPKNHQSSWRDVGLAWLIHVMSENQHRLRVDNIEASAEFLTDVATGYYHRVIELEPERLNDNKMIEQLHDLFCRYLIRDE